MNKDFTSEEFTNDLSEAGLLRQIIAGLIDAALFLTLITGSLIYLGENITIPQRYLTAINCSILLLFALYRLLCILLFKSTIGMRLVNIQFLNGDLCSLTGKEKFYAAFFILFKGVDYYNKPY